MDRRFVSTVKPADTHQAQLNPNLRTRGGQRGILYDLHRYRFFFLLVLPGILYFVIFKYIPMFGIIIAFKDFRVSRGFLGSEWVGFKHFVRFFGSPTAFRLIRNTLLLNLYGVVWGFPIPIIFAVFLSELRSQSYKKIVQTVSYLPYFLSNVVVVGIVFMLLNVNTGIVNILRKELFGAEGISFLTEPGYFRLIYVSTSIWKSFGWASVIYLAAIVGIPPELYEAAIIDGATRFQRIWRITIPCIRGTIITLLILNLGRMMTVGFEMVYLLYNPLTYEVADVIATYVYRMGIANVSGLPKYSYTTAVGLFQSVVNMILLVTANKLSNRLSGYGIF